MIEWTGTFLADLLAVVGSALRLDARALERIAADAWGIPLAILVLAALAVLAGQVGVLTLNRLRGRRLVYAAVAAAIHTLLSYVILGGVLWVISALALNTAPDLGTIVRAVMVSAAPYLFGFLVILPYLGPVIAWVLQGWTVLALWGIVAYELKLDSWSALFVMAASWLALLALDKLASRPLSWLRDRIWLALKGSPLLVTSTDLLDGFPPFGGER